MATLLRVARQGCRVFNNNLRQTTPLAQPIRLISTSKKNKDIAVADADSQFSPLHEGKKIVHFKETDDNWMSYGYSLTDREYDRVSNSMVLFMTVTLCLVWGGFIIAYMPDHKLKHWTQREGHLELERRTRLGLPLVDPNLIDPAKVDLPSEEELGDFEIVI